MAQSTNTHNNSGFYKDFVHFFSEPQEGVLPDDEFMRFVDAMNGGEEVPVELKFSEGEFQQLFQEVFNVDVVDTHADTHADIHADTHVYTQGGYMPAAKRVCVEDTTSEHDFLAPLDDMPLPPSPAPLPPLAPLPLLAPLWVPMPSKQVPAVMRMSRNRLLPPLRKTMLSPIKEESPVVALRQHERPKRDLKCPHCKRKFMYPDSLAFHEKSHH